MTSDPRRPMIEIPEPLRQKAARLLDQQMWCWGQDIRCPAGNALVRYGFERIPVAPGISGCTAYERIVPAGGQLVLWGSGLFHGDSADGGVALRRLEFRPTWTPLTRLPMALLTAGAVPCFDVVGDQERVTRLLGAAVEEIIAYETWAAVSLGADHRCRCVAAWSRAIVPADQIIPAWRALADLWRAAG
ncbi:hypothetical protein BH23PLA1_BH23PLA1_03650 [soil metagenome]